MSSHTLTVVGLYVLAGWITTGALLIIATVGKPRQAITGGTAAFIVLIDGLILLLLFAAAAQLRGA
jgi:hypothetical protein